MVAPATIFPAITTTIAIGGQPVVAIVGPLAGAMIVNPAAGIDQNLSAPENLYVDLVNPAGIGERGTTYQLSPGQAFTVPAGFTGQVSVNAVSAGHRFSAYVVHSTGPFTPFSGAFPPAGPQSLQATIGSYLYQEYSDDDDLQAFVAAYNAAVQRYVTFFNQVNLPVYTGAPIAGPLLDWVATGLYGYPRPILPSGLSQNVGPLNTWALNTLQLNEQETLQPANYYVTTDDVYKRCLTWHFGKGDGKYFNVRWLKRRVMRFLTVPNGGWAPVDQTYPVSVTWGVGNQVNINLRSTYRTATGGAILNVAPLNTFYLNEFETVAFSIPISPLAPIFKAAVEAGVLELPFQFSWTVNAI